MARGLDLNDAWSDEYSTDKLTLHLQRLYLSIVLGLASFGKQVSRLRSWKETGRTSAFCAVCFLPERCHEFKLTIEDVFSSLDPRPPHTSHPWNSNAHHILRNGSRYALPTRASRTRQYQHWGSPRASFRSPRHTRQSDWRTGKARRRSNRGRSRKFRSEYSTSSAKSRRNARERRK